MSKTVERYQNPAIGDDIKLRLHTFNSNAASDLHEIIKVDIYFLDEAYVSESNPHGIRFVESFDGNAVIHENTGVYLLDVNLEHHKYTIGRYYDVWTVKATEFENQYEISQKFEVYPDLWYSTPIPIVYDFQFRFQPNKFRKGSRQYLIIEIIPNVPTAGDLRKYYENLAIASDLKISIEQACGECLPLEQDLRMIIDKVNVDYREKRHGFYLLDTNELECGIYHVWFQLELGGNIYVSDKNTFQIYD